MILYIRSNTIINYDLNIIYEIINSFNNNFIVRILMDAPIKTITSGKFENFQESSSSPINENPTQISREPTSNSARVSSVSLPTIISATKSVEDVVRILKTLENLYALNKDTVLTASHFKYLPIHLLIRCILLETFVQLYDTIPNNHTKESLFIFEKFQRFLSNPENIQVFFMGIQREYHVPMAFLNPLLPQLKLLDKLLNGKDVSLLKQADLCKNTVPSTNNDFLLIFNSILTLRNKVLKTQKVSIQNIYNVFDLLTKIKKDVQSSLKVSKKLGSIHGSKNVSMLNFFERAIANLNPFMSFTTTKYPQINSRCQVVDSLSINQMDNVIKDLTLMHRLGICFAKQLITFVTTEEEGNVEDCLTDLTGLIKKFHTSNLHHILHYFEVNTEDNKEIEKLPQSFLIIFMKKILQAYNESKCGSGNERKQLFHTLTDNIPYDLSEPIHKFLEFVFSQVVNSCDNIHDVFMIYKLSDSSRLELENMLLTFLFESLSENDVSDSSPINIKFIKSFGFSVAIASNFVVNIMDKLKHNHFDGNKTDHFCDYEMGKKACQNLTTFNSIHTTANKSTLPLLQYCRGNISFDQYSEEAIDKSWMQTVDADTQKRPKPSTEKKKIFLKPSTKKIEKIVVPTTKTKKKRPSQPVCHAAPLTLLSGFKGFLYNDDVLKPSDVSSQNPKFAGRIFDFDQSYHIAHLDLTIEMMKLAGTNRELLPLLLANFNYYLYIVQEQAVTPIYLSKYPESELLHNLNEMSKILNLEGTPARYARGSFWYRYPNQNCQFRLLKGKTPNTLDINLKLEQELKQEDFLSLVPEFFDMTKEGIQFFISRNQDECIDPHDRIHFEKCKSDLLERVQTLDFQKNKTRSVKHLNDEVAKQLVTQSSILSGLINTLEERVSDLEKRDMPPALISILQDLRIHVKRLEKSIILLNLFPEQRYLSIHARNFVFFGQYMIEMAGAFESLAKGEEYRDHDLSDYSQILNWSKWLKYGSNALIETLNVKKGSEYIFWEFYKCKGNVPKGLRLLNDSYHMSINAAEVGEGFTPEELIMDVNDFHLQFVKLLQDEISFLDQYCNNVLAKI